VQKQGKVLAMGGIAGETYIPIGSRLNIRIAFLFSLFVRFSCVPSFLMKLIIVPLVKRKMGYMSDVNNYRAVSISMAISKLFEFVLAKFVG
jgi:hypothetical protein